MKFVMSYSSVLLKTSKKINHFYTVESEKVF